MAAVIRCSDCKEEFEGVDEFEDHDCDEQDDDPDGGGATALIADGGTYSKTDGVDATAAWKTTHENDDETYVVVLEAGDHLLTFAVDFDDDGVLIDREDIAFPRTSKEAHAAADDWTAENPKGVAGDQGFLDKLLNGGAGT